MVRKMHYPPQLSVKKKKRQHVAYSTKNSTIDIAGKTRFFFFFLIKKFIFDPKHVENIIKTLSNQNQYMTSKNIKSYPKTQN